VSVFVPATSDENSIPSSVFLFMMIVVSVLVPEISASNTITSLSGMYGYGVVDANTAMKSNVLSLASSEEKINRVGGLTGYYCFYMMYSTNTTLK
jgi:hypothetical protein